MQFLDREIDLRPYFEITHPGAFFVDLSAAGIFLSKNAGAAQNLAVLDLAADRQLLDIATARILSPIDVSKRNFWGAAYSAALRRTLVLADEASEERTNLYSIDPNGRWQRLTDVGYIYGWSISPDGRWLAYLSRAGGEFTPGDMRLIDLNAREERVIFRDSRALRLYWSNPAWSSDSQRFLVTLIADEDRLRQNVFVVRTSGADAGVPKAVTDTRQSQEIVLPRRAWLDDSRFVYLSSESGTSELYVAGEGIKPRRVGRDLKNATSAAVLRVRGQPYVVVAISRPVMDSLQIIAPSSGRVVFNVSVPEALSVEDALGSRAIIKSSSHTSPVRFLALDHDRGAFRLRPLAEYRSSDDSLVACKAEKMSFRTFDGLAAPSEDGTLHAWLFRPKRPLPPEQAVLLVEAFYGGTKSFSSVYALPMYQLFCQAGMHVLSPAPRGSWEWGKGFHDLIRGDWGGNEILDVIEATKYAQETLGIPPVRTGAFGLSHGGYAAMRLLTLPDTVNGHKVEHRFGFGISEAGISNLIRQAEESNIRGWSIDLMGEEPQENPAKWLDRSPEAHAEKLHGPLFLVHGTNDNRVRVTESRLMAKRLKALGKPVIYLELPNEGHGAMSIAAVKTYYRELFRFLQGVAMPVE